MTVIALPRHGQWAWDLRGEGRGVRVSAHADEGLLNVCLWREGTCVGTAQLLPADVANLVSGLTEGLAEIAAQPSVGDAVALSGCRSWSSGSPTSSHDSGRRPGGVRSNVRKRSSGRRADFSPTAG
jgi:hypothetical protein